jgi:hypothetical protein
VNLGDIPLQFWLTHSDLRSIKIIWNNINKYYKYNEQLLYKKNAPHSFGAFVNISGLIDKVVEILHVHGTEIPSSSRKRL